MSLFSEDGIVCLLYFTNECIPFFGIVTQKSVIFFNLPHEFFGQLVYVSIVVSFLIPLILPPVFCFFDLFPECIILFSFNKYAFI